MGIVVWLLALVVISINIYTIFDYVTDPNNPTPYETWFFVLVAVVGVAYLAFIFVVIRDDIKAFCGWLQRLGAGNQDPYADAMLNVADGDEALLLEDSDPFSDPS